MEQLHVTGVHDSSPLLVRVFRTDRRDEPWLFPAGTPISVILEPRERYHVWGLNRRSSNTLYSDGFNIPAGDYDVWHGPPPNAPPLPPPPSALDLLWSSVSSAVERLLPGQPMTREKPTNSKKQPLLERPATETRAGLVKRHTVGAKL
jgi:hypothetical protein